MGALIYDREAELIQWAETVIGFSFRADARAIGYEDASGIRAVAVYDTFSLCDCFMHIASDRSGLWLNRRSLVAAFAYPFIQLDLRRVTGFIAASNVPSLRFAMHLGFEVEGHRRNALPGDDVVMLGMLRSQCRFIPAKHRTGRR